MDMIYMLITSILAHSKKGYAPALTRTMHNVTAC